MHLWSFSVERQDSPPDWKTENSLRQKAVPPKRAGNSDTTCRCQHYQEQSLIRQVFHGHLMQMIVVLLRKQSGDPREGPSPYGRAPIFMTHSPGWVHRMDAIPNSLNTISARTEHRHMSRDIIKPRPCFALGFLTLRFSLSLCVCVCVHVSVDKISQKVLNRLTSFSGQTFPLTHGGNHSILKKKKRPGVRVGHGGWGQNLALMIRVTRKIFEWL